MDNNKALSSAAVAELKPETLDSLPSNANGVPKYAVITDPITIHNLMGEIVDE